MISKGNEIQAIINTRRVKNVQSFETYLEELWKVRYKIKFLGH